MENPGWVWKPLGTPVASRAGMGGWGTWYETGVPPDRDHVGRDHVGT